jgi:hypothetical protein
MTLRDTPLVLASQSKRRCHARAVSGETEYMRALATKTVDAIMPAC